jgi:3-oxoacyl-[acyl-carrier protein] reductase
MGDRLKDKIAIITGAGRGLGKVFALRFAEEGAKLLLPDISLERAQQTAKEVTAKGGEAYPMPADISDEKSCMKIADEVTKHFGKVDILLNNAALYGGIEQQRWDAWSVETWDKMFRINVTGTYLVCKAVAPLMVKQKKGKIINIASDVFKVPGGWRFMPYAASKAAVYSLTQMLAQALGPSGINVNSIAPGYTATEASLGQSTSNLTFDSTLKSQSIKRREEPSDLVGAAVFLASSDSDFVSGHYLVVNGGSVMV